MMSQKVSFIRKAAGFILNIGADARDSDYVRLIKRIWYVSLVVALPVSLISGLSEIWIGHKLMAGAFFLSFAIFLGFLVDGARFPNHFERNVFIVLIYFVLSPFPVTLILGGLWGSGGAIMVGLLGPGDVAVLFTDGIPEGRNARSEDFTEERLKNLALNHRGLSAAELSRRIIGDVQDFATGTEPCDDITLVIIKRAGESSPGSS